jgi:hypothetical protein
MTSPLVANVKPGDSRNYGVAKRASLWFNPASDGSDAGWSEFGNLVDLSAVPDITELEHESDRRGARTRDRIEIAQVKLNLKLKLDEIAGSNLLKAFGGSAGRTASTAILKDGKIASNRAGGGTALASLGTTLATVIVRSPNEEGMVTTYDAETFATDSMDDTAGGTFNNTTDPITVVAATYPGMPTAVGTLIKIENEILRVDATGANLTLSRGALGTTPAAHANGVSIFITGVGDYAVNLATGIIYVLVDGALADGTTVPEFHVYWTKSVATEKFQVFDGTPIRGQAQYQILTANGPRVVITLTNVTIKNDGDLTFGTGEKWIEMPLQLEALADSSGVIGYFHIIDAAVATF